MRLSQKDGSYFISFYLMAPSMKEFKILFRVDKFIKNNKKFKNSSLK